LVTKLKNIKYSIAVKVIAVILVWLSLSGILIGVIYLVDNEDIAYSKSYFDTDKFSEEYSRIVHNVVEYYVKLKSEEEIRLSSKDETVILDNIERYNTIKTRLSEQVNFSYYIKDKKTGEVFTNTKSTQYKELFEKQESTVHFNNDELSYNNSLYYTDDIGEMLRSGSYEFYAAVIVPLEKGDIYYEDYISYVKIKKCLNYCFLDLSVSLIIFVLMMVFLFYSTGHKCGKKEIYLSFIDKLYLEIHTILVLIAAIISLWFESELPIYPNYMMGYYIKLFIILSIDFFIGISYLLSIIRQIKAKSIAGNFLFLKIINKLVAFLKLCFTGKIFRVWSLVLFVLYVIINGLLSISMLYSIFEYIYDYYELFYVGIFFASLILFIALNAITLYIIAKSLKNLPEIMEAAKQISCGNLDYKLDTENMSVVFAAFAENIRSIQSGLKKAVDDAVKGERMKTDLIANVSHDLKTPLTSIISYVDLLKKEPIDNQKTQGYIEVLDEKSARLKVLIEDLIEASKASSGNLKVNMQKVDLCELVLQAIGEYREKFEKCGLEIRTNTTTKNIFVKADGKHMWRIIENLLSNVLKYSMKNSRVYISIVNSEDYGILTIKNISLLPLEMPPEQLTERFVRGDISRSTEGSGLGLSIAQSLTNMQNGIFKIEIDGDLFKVIMQIPLWK